MLTSLTNFTKRSTKDRRDEALQVVEGEVVPRVRLLQVTNAIVMIL